MELAYDRAVSPQLTTSCGGKLRDDLSLGEACKACDLVWVDTSAIKIIPVAVGEHGSLAGDQRVFIGRIVVDDGFTGQAEGVVVVACCAEEAVSGLLWRALDSAIKNTADLRGDLSNHDVALSPLIASFVFS